MPPGAMPVAPWKNGSPRKRVSQLERAGQSSPSTLVLPDLCRVSTFFTEPVGAVIASSGAPVRSSAASSISGSTLNHLHRTTHLACVVRERYSDAAVGNVVQVSPVGNELTHRMNNGQLKATHDRGHLGHVYTGVGTGSNHPKTPLTVSDLSGTETQRAIVLLRKVIEVPFPRSSAAVSSPFRRHVDLA